MSFFYGWFEVQSQAGKMFNALTRAFSLKVCSSSSTFSGSKIWKSPASATARHTGLKDFLVTKFSVSSPEMGVFYDGKEVTVNCPGLNKKGMEHGKRVGNRRDVAYVRESNCSWKYYSVLCGFRESVRMRNAKSHVDCSLKQTKYINREA